MHVRVLVAAALLAGGCAAHRPPDLADRVAPPDAASLETFVEKVRELSKQAKPRPAHPPVTLEQRDPGLAAAELLATAAPTAANHRLLAEAYVRAGVLDAAYDQYSAAVKLDPSDAASYDGLARIWRDWGFPHLGLVDAYRAIYYAPASAVPQNTLGTLLLNMGQLDNARQAFERALGLDPHAGYVFNNLCYADLMAGDGASAIGWCQRAVEAMPDLTAARNNLALAYAATGNLDAASRAFAAGGDEAAARYNMGIALMATARFDAAALAFDDAAALDPANDLSRVRARQARTLAGSATPEAADARVR